MPLRYQHYRDHVACRMFARCQRRKLPRSGGETQPRKPYERAATHRILRLRWSCDRFGLVPRVDMDTVDRAEGERPARAVSFEVRSDGRVSSLASRTPFALFKA